jgi:outer membrane protein assembly factor BamB
VNHRRFLISSIVAGGFLAGAGALAAELEQAWQVTGLDGPESAVLDAGEGVLYVSNVNGEPAAADGNGYISKLSLAGEIQDKEWVTGLNAPKGLALHDGKLYVSDIDELVVIDTASGEITARHKAPGATFLNDVTAHQDGRVFVSDMMQNQIWKLEGDQFEVWVEDQALENPNGLLAEQDRLVVGAWGKPNEDFSTDVPGHLKAVDYQSKEITSIGPGDPIGNLDGVEPDGQGGYLVTDWFSGGLYDIGADGKAEMIMDLNQGSADHEFVEDENLAVIPMMMDGTVNAYKIR